MDNDQRLNADAVYAAMVYLRDYAESPEGQAAVRALLEEKAEKADFLRSFGEAAGGATVHLRPVFEVPAAIKEEIYPGEPRRDLNRVMTARKKAQARLNRIDALLGRRN